jgi:hypothetical protein
MLIIITIIIMKHDYKRGTSEGRGGKEKILS